MEIQDFEIRGNVVDVVKERIFKGVVIVKDSKIEEIREEYTDEDVFILPGLIDAHIHIESSMLVSSEFARLAVVHGTTGTVSDPHEIANVLGLKGVRFMIENGKKVPFKFYFGAPSCVPATAFETAGGNLGLDELDELLQSDDILYLSEMMNFPGVVFGDKLVAEKLALAKHYGKPVDGHAPGLTGDLAKKYIQAGISTDHECCTLHSQRTERDLAFMPPKITDQHVVAVYFDKDKKVKRIADYGLEDGKPIDFVTRQTPTAGAESNLVRSMMGAMSSISSLSPF